MSDEREMKQQELLFSDPLPVRDNKVHKTVEGSKPKSERKASAWVPQMVNGEWEIY